MPADALFAGLLQQPAAEGDDQTAVLGQVDEPVGGEHTKVGVVPSGQRLNALDGPVDEIDQWLVAQRELAAVECGGHGGRQLVAGDLAGIVIRVEQLPPRSAVGLGPIQRDVGGTHQIGRFSVRDWPFDDADAGGHGDLVSVDGDGFTQGGQCPVGDLDHVIGTGRVFDEDHELVTTEAGDEVSGLGGQTTQPVGHRSQQSIADIVAETVVDALESVKVDEAYAQSHPGGRLGEDLHELVGEQCPVGQTGERVVCRLMPVTRLACP